MKEVKDLYATLENSYIEKYGDDENIHKYVKWLKNTYLDSLTELTTGEIVEIEKPKIKTSFWLWFLRRFESGTNKRSIRSCGTGEKI